MNTTQLSQNTATSTAERVSRRVDECATEVQGWRALAGEDVGFGFDTAQGATHLLAADEDITLAQHTFPDHKSIAFGLQAPDAMLLKRAAERPLKTLLPLLIAAQVNALIEQDGRHDEFHSLWVLSRNGHTAEVRDAVLKELHAKSAPYYVWAREIIQGHVEVYDPSNERSPLHRANFGR